MVIANGKKSKLRDVSKLHIFEGTGYTDRIVLETATEKAYQPTLADCQHRRRTCIILVFFNVITLFILNLSFR